MLLKDFLAALKFVVPAMGVKDVRYCPNGVYLEFNDDKTIRLTATDGHRLHTITMEHDHGQPRGGHIIDGASVKKWLAAAKPDRIDLDISAPCGIPLLHAIPAETIDGRYPDTARVIPSGDTVPTESIYFNTEYLAASSKALRQFGSKICHIELFGDSGVVKIRPRYITRSDIIEIICLIMPIKPNA